jgi:hypothetical protein
MQPGRNLRTVVIHKDDYQPCGGEKRAGLRPPPCPQLQGCSSSVLGRRASRVGALPSAWAGDPLLPPAFGGEGCSPALRRRRTSATRGQTAAGAVSCRVSSSSAWMALVPPPVLPPAAWSGHGCPSTARVMVASCVGRPHLRLLLRRRPHRGSYKTSYAAGAASAFLDGLVLTLAVRTGARTSSRALGRSPFTGTTLVRRLPLSSVLRWSPPLVRLPTAEVVASTGETVSVTCRRTSVSLALMTLLSPPIGRRGQGPFRSGVRAEVIATAGGSSVQRWPPPVLMWSPPLASRSELVIPRPYRCGGSSYL